MKTISKRVETLEKAISEKPELRGKTISKRVELLEKQVKKRG